MRFWVVLKKSNATSPGSKLRIIVIDVEAALKAHDISAVLRVVAAKGGGRLYNEPGMGKILPDFRHEFLHPVVGEAVGNADEPAVPEAPAAESAQADETN